MNILVVSSYLPYPLHSGGDVRLYNLLLRLAKKHTITLVCEIRPHQTKEDIEAIKKICSKVIVIPRKKQWSMKNIMKAGTSVHSFLITGHTLPKMKEVISKLVASQPFDLIHVETFYVMQNIPKTTVPIVLTEHNIEYQVYEKYAAGKPYALKKLLAIDILKLRKEEEEFWMMANKVVVVSEHEKNVVENIRKDVAIVPNGVDIQLFKEKDTKDVYKKEKRLLYIGNYKWIQNQNALYWILQEIWPLIEKRTDKSVKFWVVGRDLPASFQKYKSERVILEGQSDKPAQELFAESFALLAPLRVAGGTQYKILESMAVGTPVITTPLGVIGLSEMKKETILTGETAEDITEKTVMLLNDSKLYDRLSRNSRNHVVKHFSFDAIAEKLDKVYHEVAKS